MRRPIVLITGASSGIGAALAEEYSKLEWNLVLVARREDQLRDTALNCKSRFPGIKIHLLPADVGSNDFTEKLKAYLSEHGVTELDAVYVNAGIGNAGRFEKLPVSDFERVLNVNTLGAVRTIQGTLEPLKRARGKLVIVSSINGHIGFPMGSAYNTSKFAVRGLALSIDAELAVHGVQVSIACPGPVRTNIVALDNQGRPAPEAAEFFKNKPALPAPVAARRMISKVNRGKREFTVSFTTDVLLFVNHHFPRLTAWVMRWTFKKYEKKIASMIAKANPNAV